MPSRLANSWSDRARPLTSSSNHARPRAIALISAGSHVELRRGLLLGPDVASSASETASDSAVELTATAAFTRRGAETKLVLPGLAPQKHSLRCDPALIIGNDGITLCREPPATVNKGEVAVTSR